MIKFKARALKWNQHAIQLSHIDWLAAQSVLQLHDTYTFHKPPPHTHTSYRTTSARRAFVSREAIKWYANDAPASHTVRWTDNHASERELSVIYKHMCISDNGNQEINVFLVCVRVCVYLDIRVYLHTFGMPQKSAKPHSRVDDFYLFDSRTRVRELVPRRVDPSIPENAYRT